eukprot:Skav235679  [mRNA]  locus=scaffold358:1243207:1247076:+ [translate_table: standard]
MKPAAIIRSPWGMRHGCTAEAAAPPKLSRKSVRHLSLLDLRTTEGDLNVGQGSVPVHLLEELVHVALLGHQDGTLAIRHRLEELHSQASRAHLSSKPHPALAIILHLLGLIHAVANATLGHEHWVGHLLLQLGNAHSDVLLADVSWRRSLPKSGVALEALRSEVTVEELHDQLGEHGALWWVAASTGQQTVVEVLNVCITDVILATTTSTQGHRLRAGRLKGGTHKVGGQAS